MFMESFPVGMLQCYCTVPAATETGRAIIIDPGDEAERIAAAVEARNFTVTHILHTHAHIDHVGGSADLKSRCGGQAWLHRDDLFLLEGLQEQARFLGGKAPEAVALDGHLEEGQSFDVGDDHLTVLHTPGHTPGSCSFLIEADSRQVLFAGDTLFRDSIGRTDLPGGNTKTIMKSLKGKLLELDDETEVITGHGPETTIGRERQSNPFLTGRYTL